MKKILLVVILPAILLSLSHLAAGQASSSLDQDLIKAAENGDVAQIQQLLVKGADIEAKNGSGYPALVLAAQNGHTDAVKLLLEKGANIEAHSGNGYTALHNAAGNGHIDVLKLLLDKGAKIETKDGNGYTALFWAEGVYSGMKDHADVVKLLLEKGANVETTDRNGRTALEIAVERGEVDIVRLLVAKSTNVGMAASKFQQELIGAASSCNSLAQVRKLAAALAVMGANLNAKDQGGQTALMKAVRMADCNADVARFLIDNGADVNAFDRGGTTALMTAASHGQANLVRALIERGANMNAQSDSGDTALTLACGASPHSNVVRILIEKGANLNLTRNGQTALDSAVFMKSVGRADFGFGPNQEREIGEIVNMLRQAGARCPTFCR